MKCKISRDRHSRFPPFRERRVGHPPVPSGSPVEPPVNAQMNGTKISSVSAQGSFGVKKLNLTMSGYANLSNQNCP
jgi:hypothetical protein